MSGFSWVVLTNCFSSIFHFRQISKFKKSVIQIKIRNQNFLWICPSTHYVLHNYKVSRNSVERFQRSCANKRNGTDWLTDGRVKNIIPKCPYISIDLHSFFFFINFCFKEVVLCHNFLPSFVGVRDGKGLQLEVNIIQDNFPFWQNLPTVPTAWNFTWDR